MRNQLMLLNRSGKKDDKSRDPYKDIAVKNTIRKKAGEIQACYNELISRIESDASKKNINTDGKLELDWQIDTDGEVIKPEAIFSEIKDKQFIECTIKKISKWVFPEPPLGNKVYIYHKFKFSKK